MLKPSQPIGETCQKLFPLSIGFGFPIVIQWSLVRTVMGHSQSSIDIVFLSGRIKVADWHAFIKHTVLVAFLNDIVKMKC